MVHANDAGQMVEREMVDVVVVLDVSTPQEARDAVRGLASAGLMVMKVDAENGVVEGVIDPSELPALKRLPAVKYTRLRFAYMAEPTAPATQHDTR